MHVCVVHVQWSCPSLRLKLSVARNYEVPFSVQDFWLPLYVSHCDTFIQFNVALYHTCMCTL